MPQDSSLEFICTCLKPLPNWGLSRFVSLYLFVLLTSIEDYSQRPGTATKTRCASGLQTSSPIPTSKENTGWEPVGRSLGRGLGVQHPSKLKGPGVAWSSTKRKCPGGARARKLVSIHKVAKMTLLNNARPIIHSDFIILIWNYTDIVDHSNNNSCYDVEHWTKNKYTKNLSPQVFCTWFPFWGWEFENSWWQTSLQHLGHCQVHPKMWKSQ